MSDERGLMTLQETMSLGGVLAKSGYFKDVQGEAQAVVKVLAGREMGFGPIASIGGVHIVQGKPSIGANLIGAAVKGSIRYDYRVIELTDERAEIAFYESEELGRSVFTMADAKKAGLASKQVWKQYPRNMLFSRAMSNGARWYCPDVFSGVTPYTPEEMGAEVDRDGDVIDVTPTPVTEEPAPIETAPDSADTTVPADALGDEPTITSPKELLAAVAHLDYFDQKRGTPHMLNAVKKQTGYDKKSWPTNDPAWYANAYDALVEHVNANKALEAENAKAVISEAAKQASF